MDRQAGKNQHSQIVFHLLEEGIFCGITIDLFHTRKINNGYYENLFLFQALDSPDLALSNYFSFLKEMTVVNNCQESLNFSTVLIITYWILQYCANRTLFWETASFFSEIVYSSLFREYPHPSIFTLPYLNMSRYIEWIDNH